MNYSNHASRLRLQDSSAATPQEQILSLEPGKRGFRLRARTAATMARRKFEPYRLPVAAAIAATAFLAPVHPAKAQLGSDPFASNLIRNEEKWSPYTDASTGGTNRPVSTTVNGVAPVMSNATSFNFAVSAPSTATSGAFLTSGGNIYSPTGTLTLLMTSAAAPTVGTFQTVVFSIKVLGTQLNNAGVLLTPNGGTAIAPIYQYGVLTGSGMGASTQYAFQFDLSGVGGSNNFSITVPGSGPSASFSSAQLDATTAAYGAVNAIPEPSSLVFAAVALGGVSAVVLRRRRVN